MLATRFIFVLLLVWVLPLGVEAPPPDKRPRVDDPPREDDDPPRDEHPPPGDDPPPHESQEDDPPHAAPADDPRHEAGNAPGVSSASHPVLVPSTPQRSCRPVMYGPPGNGSLPAIGGSLSPYTRLYCPFCGISICVHLRDVGPSPPYFCPSCFRELRFNVHITLK